MFDWINLAAWKAEIIAADPVEFFVWSIFGAAIAFTSSFGIFRNIQRARIIEDTPTSKIRSAVQGYVEIMGFGKYFNKTPVIAPLTLNECIWYAFEIEKKEVRHTSKGTQTHWRTVESETSPEYFKVIDETGDCVINPAGAEVHPDTCDVWYGHSRWPDKASVLKARQKSFFNTGNYRYTERRIHKGDNLYVLGKFRTIGPGADMQPINQRISRLLKSWKSQQQSLLEKFDKNRDGEIDIREWEQVRKAAYNRIMQERLEKSVEPITHLMETTRHRHQPFILSTKPQKELSRRFRIVAGLSLVVFVIVAPLYIWMLFVRFNI